MPMASRASPITSATPPTMRLAHPTARPAAAKPATAAWSRITKAGTRRTAPPTTRPSAMPISPRFSDISARASWPSLRTNVVNWFARSMKIAEIGRLVSMYAIGTSLAIIGGNAVRGIARAFQEPRQPHRGQENPGYNCGGLLATQIADKGCYFIEIGVAQEIRDMLESCRSIVDVPRNLGKMLLKVSGRVMPSRRQASHPQGGRSSLLRRGLAGLQRRIRGQRSYFFEISIAR